MIYAGEMRQILLFLAAAGLASAAEDFPIVPDDVDVIVFAQEPLVRNPCGLAFDSKGRLCVGMGPQYRKPKPDTPGDSVWILIDEDGDGVADGRKEFATGFNSIQSMAWRGDALWVANAPDLTVVRDLDGDDEADEYVRLYTDLGNLEHGLHGLNWGPDGKLYMSKGNSKGLNKSPDRLAPKPFRELWGMTSPPGAPDFPEPITFKKGNYQKNYHHPSDDWGLCGGVLRCDEDGSNLEIVSRGSRNPWDMAFDDEFNWLGTDNDQSHGDKFFSPFFGAHFGWGHPWSYDWEGVDHWPSAPSAGPLFEGSGTGVVYLGDDRYPEKYRGVFLVNDWLKRQVYIYRPKWDGAWLKPDANEFDLFAHAERGRSMQLSDGRRFDPVDIELGADGAVYISSWGRQYGALVEDGRQVNEGRIYKLWPKSAPPSSWGSERDPWKDLDSRLPVWRTNGQDALVKQGLPAVARLKSMATDPTSSVNLQTWAAWTVGRIAPDDVSIDDWFESLLKSDALNLRIQSVRILAYRSRLRDDRVVSEPVVALLGDSDARVRHEAVLALRQVNDRRHRDALIGLSARETDRVVYYATWGAMGALMSVDDRKALLSDARVGVRRAVLLSLLEEGVLGEDQLRGVADDTDASIAALATQWLGGKAEPVLKGPSLEGDHEMSDDDRRPISVVSSIHAESGREYVEAILQIGARSYTDRRYRVRSLPDELVGETFIRGANDDADAESGTSLTVTLRYPSTVFLADDQRGERLPRWAEGKFEPTEMRLHNGDAEMRVYRAEMPPGTVTFGSNREGVAGKKGNFLVIIRPKLLNPSGTTPSLEDVLPLMGEASAERGRALVLSRHGGTCSNCHQLEGYGNVFAPDLSDIGTRADARFVIRSILEPSAEITEGFAMQAVTTKGGETLGGVVLGETGRSLTFGVLDGSQQTVSKADVVSRETAEVSAMPALGALLSAQQIADMTAYLLGNKAVNVNVVASEVWGDATEGWQLKGDDQSLVIRLDGKDVLSYFFKHEETKRPFFAHVKTPSGIQVTRNFPPIEGVDPTDHAYMHPGLSLGFSVLAGENFWHNDRGVVVHEAFVKEPSVTETSAQFSVRNRYVSADGKRTVCQEIAHYEFSKNEDGYLIRLHSEFTSDEAIRFGVKEEMGLAIRVASPIRVKKGNGAILSAGGGIDEKGTWGKVDQWWDYYGPIEDRSVGLQIMTGAGNPEVWAHSRDYGVLVANPFPVDVKANRGLETVVEPGTVFRLRFGIQVHDSADRDAYDPKKAYQRYLGQP